MPTWCDLLKQSSSVKVSFVFSSFHLKLERMKKNYEKIQLKNEKSMFCKNLSHLLKAGRKFSFVFYYQVTTSFRGNLLDSIYFETFKISK